MLGLLKWVGSGDVVWGIEVRGWSFGVGASGMVER